MKSHNTKRNNLIILSVSSFIVIVLLNIYLSFYPFVRIDFSQGKVYSLSDTSKEIIKDLEDIVNIKIYMTQDLPAEMKPVAKNLKTILNEFERTNTKRIKLIYFDPSKDASIKNDAELLGIQQLQFSSMKENKLEVSNAYFGLSMSYGQNSVVMPVAADVENLEYFLVSGIKRVASNKVPKVAIAEELFSQRQETETIYLRKFLNQNYDIGEVNLDSDSEFDESNEAIIIINRNKKLNQKNIEKITNWINKGKGLIVFQDRINVDEYMKATLKEETGLETILKTYGFEFENKLVMDESAFIANFKTSKGTYTIPYQYWIQVRPEYINKEIPVNSGISKIILEWASPLKINGDAVPLFLSSDKASLDDKYKELAPVENKLLPKEKNQYVLGAINNSNNYKIAVIGDSSFIKDSYVINNQQNLVLAANLVDYFSQDSSLMKIRSKNISSTPIKIIKDNTKNFIKYFNVILPIFTLTILYFIITIVRKNRNSSF